QVLASLRSDGTLPRYPLGSDFTPVEQRLVEALAWLKANTVTPGRKLRTVLRAITSTGAGDAEAITRMQLGAPKALGDRLQARLLALALRQTTAG
ncbi:MAG: acetyl-CoA hydrolase, partial [Pseudomonadota bacterium]|nr:acetyl-CoA hydrolase [Pseudomonadota bacterium]